MGSLNLRKKITLNNNEQISSFSSCCRIAVQNAYVLDAGNYNPEQRLQYIIDGLAGDFGSDNLVKRADGMLAPAMMSRHFSLLSRYGGVKGGHFDSGRMAGFGKRK